MTSFVSQGDQFWNNKPWDRCFCTSFLFYFVVLIIGSSIQFSLYLQIQTFYPMVGVAEASISKAASFNTLYIFK